MKKTLKLSSLVAFCAAFFTGGVIFANTISFPDVQPTDWFYSDVMNMVEWDVIRGNDDGTFKPDDNVNRAELSAMWNRYEGHLDEKFVPQDTVDALVARVAALEEELDVEPPKTSTTQKTTTTAQTTEKDPVQEEEVIPDPEILFFAAHPKSGSGEALQTTYSAPVKFAYFSWDSVNTDYCTVEWTNIEGDYTNYSFNNSSSVEKYQTTIPSTSIENNKTTVHAEKQHYWEDWEEWPGFGSEFKFTLTCHGADGKTDSKSITLTKVYE